MQPSNTESRSVRVMSREDKSVCPDRMVHYYSTEFKELEVKDKWIIRDAYKLMSTLASNNDTPVIPNNFGAVLFITVYPLIMDQVRQNVGDYQQDAGKNMHPVSVHFTLHGQDARFKNTKGTWSSSVGVGSVLVVQHIHKDAKDVP